MSIGRYSIERAPEIMVLAAADWEYILAGRCVARSGCCTSLPTANIATPLDRIAVTPPVLLSLALLISFSLCLVALCSPPPGINGSQFSVVTAGASLAPLGIGNWCQ